MRYLLKLLLPFVLILAAGCQEHATLKIGGKDFAESQILSEMMALLAEAEGIPVTRRIGLGPTRLNLEALKRGDIDLYAEYNGTGLVMLGQPALADGDAAQARVREIYEPIGLHWGERFGFANNYGLLMRDDVAARMGVTRISDLVDKAGDLTVGIDTNFQSRPLDGFRPLLGRYGMEFGNVMMVSPDERPQLYDMLLEGSVDVVEGFTTDGQIADYNLVLLEDDLQFFPVYQAAPLVRADALERFPALGNVFAELAGALDEETMQDLNRRVDLDGQSPRVVARAALAEMGLLEGVAAAETSEPLVVATSPLTASDREVGTALHAVRDAYAANRPVELAMLADPLAAITAGEARIAIASTAEFFALDEAGTPALRGNVEALGVVGESTVHVLALDPALADIRDAELIVTGPPGSGSAKAAAAVARGLEAGAAVEPLAGETPEALVAAIEESGADIAILMAALNDPAILRLLDNGARLLSLTGWDEGINLVRYPYLREARIPADSYGGLPGPVETLSAQLVLVGPGQVERDAVGDQGPGASYTTQILPLNDDTAKTINAALPLRIDIDPSVPQAAVLAPQLPDPPAAVNPAPDVSFISILVLAMLVWMVWLYVRPERR